MAGQALTAGQAAALRAAAQAAAHAHGGSRARFILPGTLPSAFSQEMRGSCVANAVAALVEYSEGCSNRLSVQYLLEATHLVEEDWISRNLQLLRTGKPTEPDFAAAFSGPVRQIELLVKTNVAGTPAADAFVDSFGRQVRKRLNDDSGARLRRTFEALARFGICRYSLWPYARVAIDNSASADALGEFPPKSHDDARKHRIPLQKLYTLRSPNNVEEIKRLLKGDRSRRPMPVCIGVELFDGCDGESFTLPHVCEGKNGAETVEAPKGLHEILLIGYEDNPKTPGGGSFIFLNSWGAEWGDHGRGKIPYSYVECFSREAGTIVRDRTSIPRALALAVTMAAIIAGLAGAMRIYLPNVYKTLETIVLNALPAATKQPAQPTPVQPTPVQPTPEQPVPVQSEQPAEQPVETQATVPAASPQPEQPAQPVQPVQTPEQPKQPVQPIQPPVQQTERPPQPEQPVQTTPVAQPQQPEPAPQTEPQTTAGQPHTQKPDRPRRRREKPDGSLQVERKLVEWQFLMRIDCPTQDDARAVIKALQRRRGAEFDFTPELPAPKSRKSIRGTIVIDAPRSRPPMARSIVREHIERYAPDAKIKDFLMTPKKTASDND